LRLIFVETVFISHADVQTFAGLLSKMAMIEFAVLLVSSATCFLFG